MATRTKKSGTKKLISKKSASVPAFGWRAKLTNKKVFMPLIAILLFAGFGVYKLAFSSAYHTSRQYRMLFTNVCWDVPGGNYYAGAKLQMWDCNGQSPQKWYQMRDGTIRPAAASNLCIDLPRPDGKIITNTQLILWPCHGGPNQKWDPSYVTFKNAPSVTFQSQLTRYDLYFKVCIDDGGGRGYRGDRLIIWDCNGQSPQKWYQ